VETPQTKSSSATLWFYSRDGKQSGPNSEEDIRSFIAQGQIGIVDLVWREGMTSWTPAHQALGIALPPLPPPVVTDAPVIAADVQAPLAVPKVRLVFVFLGICLGQLGIHNFYAGYAGRAVAQLLITLLLGWWLCFPLALVWFWNIFEVMTVTQDARGVAFA
jgi:TM2 domain-containing membrane protein YozV